MFYSGSNFLGEWKICRDDAIGTLDKQNMIRLHIRTTSHTHNTLIEKKKRKKTIHLSLTHLSGLLDSIKNNDALPFQTYLFQSF